jgi:hypothetical protein
MMDIQMVKPVVVHAGRRLALYLLISGVLAIGALAWATGGFRALPTWADIKGWHDGELIIDLPSIDQSYPSDYETKD